jgi:hypothetical protein
MARNEDDKLDEVDIEDVEDYHDVPASSKKTTAPMEQARKLLNLDEHQLPLVGVLFSAVILLVAVTSKGGPGKQSGYFVYGIILSVVAMICSIVGLGLTHKPELVQDRPDVPNYLNQFLLSWNFIGACIMTFGSGPFVITSNGYFAAWGTAIFAFYGMGMSSDSVKNAGSTIGHLVASIVVIIALASANGSFDNFKGESIFGMILACLSAVLMACQIQSERADKKGIDKNALFPIMAIFAVLWIVAASLMTFRGPFLRTSNGYFGAWGGAVTAVFIAMAIKPGD